MHDELLVRGREAPGNLDHDRKRALGSQRTTSEDPVERFAFVIRHRDEDLARLGLVDLVNRADVRMIEQCCGLRLLDETVAHRRVGKRTDELERHRSTEPQVGAAIDFAHSSRTEELFDLVVGNDLPRSLSLIHRQPPRAGDREVDGAANFMMRLRLLALQAGWGAVVSRAL